MFTPFVPIAADAILTAAGGVLAPLVGAVVLGLAEVALGVAAVLALIMATFTPAHAPGLPQPLVSPAELRLRKLVAGTLTQDEEAELIALLAKVKGIHINSLQDLQDPHAATLPLKGLRVPLRNLTYLRDFSYTKRSAAAKDAPRRKFKSSGGKQFLKSLAADPVKMARMKKLGMSEKNLERIRKGDVPIDYQVHHKLSLDDGGDNSLDNLVLIKNDPYHKAITAFRNGFANQLKPGETKVLDWPIVNDYIYPNY